MRLYMTELVVGDWVRSVAWYRDALGLPVEMVDEARNFALLGSDGGRIALKAGKVCATTPPVRLTFFVDDLEEARSRFIRCGESCGPISADPHEGFRSFRANDPDGVPIQVFAWGS